MGKGGSPHEQAKPHHAATCAPTFLASLPLGEHLQRVAVHQANWLRHHKAAGYGQYTPAATDARCRLLRRTLCRAGRSAALAAAGRRSVATDNAVKGTKRPDAEL
jgi:hypothetical protein